MFYRARYRANTVYKTMTMKNSSYSITFQKFRLPDKVAKNRENMDGLVCACVPVHNQIPRLCTGQNRHNTFSRNPFNVAKFFDGVAVSDPDSRHRYGVAWVSHVSSALPRRKMDRFGSWMLGFGLAVSGMDIVPW